ncbi:MAG: imidazoleglycerol-phosphate dehydratase HisB [Alphaproteobacteria bacterium]|nr:MAG: imidazoleglycerol-phosphate dehydratase HisB [Alphaproteobacteria bacterium]
MRKGECRRETRETQVAVSLVIEGSGRAHVATGIGFLDHMLEQLARHGGFDLTIQATGDTHVDCHHTVEDVGLALGVAFDEALGERAGIHRFAHAYIAMDEALTRAVVDVSGRPYLVWKARFTQPRLGDLDTEMIEHFFRSFAMRAKLTLHVENLYGANNHHIAESAFKAVARALREAVTCDPKAAGAVPSTKGVLNE